MPLILNLPDSAKIIKRQKCAVSAFDASSYTLRSSHAPLAEISVEIEILEQAEIDALIAQIKTVHGADYVEMPYVTNGEHYLVQEYKTAPLLYGVYSSLSLTMVQQRSVLVPEDNSLFRCPHIALYDSNETISFRNIAQQFGNGYQAVKAKGEKSLERYWDVVFHLNSSEAQLLDRQLTAKRGIYPFQWSPTNDLASEETWLCSEWQIEYLSYELYIFSGKFLATETFRQEVTPPATWRPANLVYNGIREPGAGVFKAIDYYTDGNGNQADPLPATNPASVWVLPTNFTPNLDDDITVGDVIDDFSTVNSPGSTGLTPILISIRQILLYDVFPVWTPIQNNASLTPANVLIFQSQNWQIPVTGFLIVISSSAQIQASDVCLFWNQAQVKTSNIAQPSFQAITLPALTAGASLEFVNYGYDLGAFIGAINTVGNLG